MFQAEHGDDPAAAYERALTAYEGRPSVTAAEIVAWTAYKAGRLDAAQDYIARALALGTKSGRLSYHAGIIARASGDEAAAKRHFEDARDMRAELSPVYRADLDSMVGGG